jgi:hypothetical protein
MQVVNEVKSLKNQNRQGQNNRWTFKSFIHILDFCQQDTSHLSRGQITMELFSFLDPVWNEKKNKDNPNYDSAIKDARRYSQKNSTRKIPKFLQDKATSLHRSSLELPDHFCEFIKRFDKIKLFYYLEKIIAAENQIENILKSDRLGEILEFIDSNDIENTVVYSLLDVCGEQRENANAPDLIKDFFIANKELSSENSRKKVEVLTKSPRLLVKQYKQRDQGECETLRQALDESNGKVYIQGLSGLGKSEFAKEFWDTSKKSGQFKYLAWIDFDGDLESSFYNQFDPLNTVTSPHVNRYELLKSIENMGNQLLIVIDNFSSADGFRKDSFLTDLCALNCALVITTTEKLDYSGLKIYELSPLSLDNSVALFKDYYSVEDNEEKIATIIKNLGFHTLLVELIAKSSNEENFSLDEIIDFISKNNLDYSDIEVSSNHDRLTTDESVSRQLELLFSVISKHLSEKEIDLLIKFSIFKTIPFSLENARLWFEFKSAKSLRRLVKLGWIKSESYLGLSHKFYSIHVAPALMIINQFDIAPYYERFASDIIGNIRDHDMSESHHLNADFIRFMGAFINTFLEIEHSFEFVIMQCEYVFKLNQTNFTSDNHIGLCKKYLGNAKRILESLNDTDFDKFNQTTHYIHDLGMNSPYTMENLKYRLRFEIDNLLVTVVGVEKSRNSLEQQEQLYCKLLDSFPKINNQELEYEYLTTHNNLLRLYCEYEQKEKLLPLIDKIKQLQKNIPSHKPQDTRSILSFTQLKFLSCLNIGNSYIQLENYDSASKYLSEARKIIDTLTINKANLSAFDYDYATNSYAQAMTKLSICKDSGMNEYKKWLLNKYETAKNSDLEDQVKEKMCELILFEYDPFFKNRSDSDFNHN